jgi:putative transposase
VQAWCLMGNHFHLVVETPRGNLVAGMKWLLGTYTQRYNRRHKQSGHLFQGRYKAQVIDAARLGYLRAACDYVHLNPVRAKLLPLKERLEKWPWSSYPAYLRPARRRPGWLRVERLLGEHGVQRDDARGRRRFGESMEARRLDDARGDLEVAAALRRGWRLGAEDFVDRLLERIRPALKRSHSAVTRKDSDEAVARAIIAQSLEAERMAMRDLPLLRKGDCVKVKIARRLRDETTLTLEQIAQRLNMGVASHVAHLLYHRKNER